jgi:glycosyltransferase involved in cell wall biosynthesis
MKILFLTQWYLPEPARLLAELAESLQGLGHDVTVLTGFPNFPTGRLHPGYRIRCVQRETIQGVPVCRVPLYPDHGRSFVKRGLNYLSFAASASILGPFLTERPDVVHVYHPPLTAAWPAQLLGLLRGAPFTCEVQDLWPDSLRATGMSPPAWAFSALEWCAKRIYRRAAAVRVTSPGIVARLESMGVPRSKVHVISNWVDTEFYRPREPDGEFGRKLGLTGRFNVMFAGTVGLAQGMDTILECAAQLADLPAVQFVIAGGGVDLERLRRVVSERRLTNVLFLGLRPIDEVPKLLALADVLLLHLRDAPLFRMTIPHKTFLYLASGKPILAAVEGDAAEVVRQADAGIACPPQRPAAMAEAVRRLYAMQPSERNALGENGRHAAVERFGRQTLVREVADMLETVVRERQTR